MECSDGDFSVHGIGVSRGEAHEEVMGMRGRRISEI